MLGPATGLATGTARGWRRVIAGVLIHALVLQGIAFALAGASRAVNAAGGGDFTAYELCRHDGGTPASRGDSPETPAADTHCIFCLAGAHQALDVPVCAPEYHAIAIPVAPWPFAVWRLPTATVDASARPRGPPPVA